VSAEQIHDWMNTRIAKHKRLVGGIAFVPEIPKLASGKLVRKVLKEWAKKDAQLMEGKIRARL
jgi:4-coumarate--CoA ligase